MCFCGFPVSSVTTPNPATPGGAPQTTTTAYTNLLQATSVLNPDGTTVASEYHPRSVQYMRARKKRR